MNSEGRKVFVESNVVIRRTIMGCSTSKSKNVLNQVSPPPSESTAVLLVESDSDSFFLGQERPRPLIFAIIRNGHEVVRGRLRDVEIDLLQKEYDLAEAEWRHLKIWFFQWHRKMELGSDDHLGFLSYVFLST